MTFTRFLMLAGGCFILAAALWHFQISQAGWALMVPGVVFLICGAAGMIHHFWTSGLPRAKPGVTKTQ